MLQSNIAGKIFIEIGTLPIGFRPSKVVYNSPYARSVDGKGKIANIIDSLKSLLVVDSSGLISIYNNAQNIQYEYHQFLINIPLVL